MSLQVFRFLLSSELCIIGDCLINPWPVKSVLCPDLNEKKKDHEICVLVVFLCVLDWPGDFMILLTQL